MFNVIVCLIDIFVAWRWGDWRNWKKYQSTILYLIVCDLVYNFLTYNYPLWIYKATPLFPNHTLMSLLVMFVAYPCVILVYLGRYPSGQIKQLLWIILWTFLWSVLEYASIYTGNFFHYNGWNMAWSVLFNIALFTMVRLHYKNSLLVYVLSVIATVVLLLLFEVPISKMK